MIRLSVAELITALCISSPLPGQALPAQGQIRLDYASGEHDSFPNITCGTATNTSLKLDLYLPNSRPAPGTTASGARCLWTAARRYGILTKE